MKKNILGWAFGGLIMVSGLTSCLKQDLDDMIPVVTPPGADRPFEWAPIADSAQAALNNFFWNASGRYYTSTMNGGAFNSNYWPNAHGLDVLIDAYLRKDKDPAIKQQMDNLIEGLKAANGNTYSNYYYDDMEWLLISSLRAFKETGDNRYRVVADELWTDVKTGWDNVTGGGFYWRKDRVNKNTPANAPALIYITRKYRQTNDPADLAWANQIYAWLKTHMIRSSGDVWDGISSFSPVSYDTRLFSYNYGTVIGGALELFLATNNPQYKADAVAVAAAAISVLSRDGVLPPGDNGDGGLFNGIFVRYLTRLIVEGNIDPGSKANFIGFLENNAKTLWTKGTVFPNVLIGPDWQNAPASTTLNPQLSGVMLLEAMAELEKLDLLP